jgi:hypothetical protein
MARTYTPIGLRALLLTVFQPGVEAFYATPELDTVSTLGLDVAGGLLVVAAQTGTFTQAGASGKGGELLTQKVSFTAPDDAAGTISRRLNSLLGLPLHALSLDLAGRWWWLGQEYGLTLETQGTPGESCALTLSGLEYTPAAKVFPALIPGFLAALS